MAHLPVPRGQSTSLLARGRGRSIAGMSGTLAGPRLRSGLRRRGGSFFLLQTFVQGVMQHRSCGLEVPHGCKVPHGERQCLFQQHFVRAPRQWGTPLTVCFVPPPVGTLLVIFAFGACHVFLPDARVLHFFGLAHRLCRSRRMPATFSAPCCWRLVSFTHPHSPLRQGQRGARSQTSSVHHGPQAPRPRLTIPAAFARADSCQYLLGMSSRVIVSPLRKSYLESRLAGYFLATSWRLVRSATARHSQGQTARKQTTHP
jgi:hypothetical protein